MKEALGLREEWNQKKVSLLEQKEIIEDRLLKRISEVLKIPVEVFQNFDEEHAINIISNTFHDFKDNSVASAMNYNCTFSPIDEIKKLHEKSALYKRMLKQKDEMMGKLIEKK